MIIPAIAALLDAQIIENHFKIPDLVDGKDIENILEYILQGMVVPANQEIDAGILHHQRSIGDKTGWCGIYYDIFIPGLQEFYQLI
jgi:hypothetical protein